MPPGPLRIPIIGNLLSLASKDSLSNLANLRKKYGDVYSLYVGNKLVVFLNGYDAINDALVKKGSLFARRPVTPFSTSQDIFPAIVTANGQTWRENRAFTILALDQVSVKNKGCHIEEIIAVETTALMDKLETLSGSVDPRNYLLPSVSNVITSFLFSQRFDLDDKEFIGFLEYVDSNEKYLPRAVTLVNCFPFLLKLPGDVLGTKRMIENQFIWLRLLNKYLSDRKFDGAKTDFVDSYMQSIAENEIRGHKQTLTKQNMFNATFDLVIAGSGTVSATISWLLLYILHDSNLQATLHSEIDDVIGRKRLPALEDRRNMPYTEATILEALRIAAVVPLGLPHSVPFDTVFKGYLIPQDSTVITNFNSVMMDPEIWPHPEKFFPERFLSSDRKTVKIPKEFTPFALGPRSCLGERLAKMELFLYLTSLMQRFRLSPSGANLPRIKGSVGVIYRPDPYQICFIKR